ncbi:hypothetical protein RCZ04_21550 [Capnocytophaga sp. HP1101]
MFFEYFHKIKHYVRFVATKVERKNIRVTSGIRKVLCKKYKKLIIKLLYCKKTLKKYWIFTF